MLNEQPQFAIDKEKRSIDDYYEIHSITIKSGQTRYSERADYKARMLYPQSKNKKIIKTS